MNERNDMSESKEHSKQKGPIIGIDLGTTNSCLAVMEGGSVKVIPSPEGTNTTPSVVCLKGSERIVGVPAKRQMITNPMHTLFSTKRFIGRKFSEVQDEIKLVPYKVVPDANGNAVFEVDGKVVTPEEAGAMILKKLKETAEAYLGHKVTEAVITVPAYFNDSQRQSTKDAGRIAGLDVKRIINEPTAAALAYGLDKGGDKKIVVFDLGGGTFDVSVLEIGDGVFQVLATNGDTHLGGDDFDAAIMHWMVDQFKAETGIDLAKDKMALQRLRDAAEKAKIELSSTLSTEINQPFITMDATGPKHLQLTLTRAKLESLVHPLLERLKEPCLKALKDSGLDTAHVQEVILVGGMTRMPAVQTIAKDLFQREPHKGVNPDEVVAVGAAIQGGVLRGEVKDVLLLDVIPLTLGIETLGGIMTPIVERNTTIPVQRKQVFSTAADNQPAVTIVVLQGERKLARDNKEIGRFDLSDLPPSPRGMPQIEVAFDIDANGILHVHAKDLNTGKEQKIRIEAKSGLDEDEIKRMLRDAEAHAEEDKRRKEEIEARNEADAAVFRAEKSLLEFKEKIPAEIASEIQSKIDAVKTAMAGGQPEQLKQATAELGHSMSKIGEHLAKAGGEHQSPPGSHGGGAGPGVQDADVEILDPEQKA
jgi:molecular chaperone DnaK